MIVRLLVFAVSAELAAACSAKDVPLFEVSRETAGREGTPDTGGDTSTGGRDAGSKTAGATNGTEGGMAGTLDAWAGATNQAPGGTAGATGTPAKAGQPSQGGAAGGSGGAAGAGGRESVPEIACASDFDCSPGWLCHKLDCTAEWGACEPRAVFCDPRPRPVCGCDGTTYWNECVWRQVGTTSYVDGECGANARPCESWEDCVPGVASCSRLVFQPEGCLESVSTGQFGLGVCWVPPPMCDPMATTDRWIICSQLAKPPPPGGILCVDTCTAIRSEFPHYQARAEDGCP